MPSKTSSPPVLITEPCPALSSIGDTRLTIEALQNSSQRKASVRRAEEYCPSHEEKNREGSVPITKENIPQFLKSKLIISGLISKIF
jgi:hypothetical protein